MVGADMRRTRRLYGLAAERPGGTLGSAWLTRCVTQRWPPPCGDGHRELSGEASQPPRCRRSVRAPHRQRVRQATPVRDLATSPHGGRETVSIRVTNQSARVVMLIAIVRRRATVPLGHFTSSACSMLTEYADRASSGSAISGSRQPSARLVSRSQAPDPAGPCPGNGKCYVSAVKRASRRLPPHQSSRTISSSGGVSPESMTKWFRSAG